MWAATRLLLNGGTLEIDSPYPYSKIADGLMKTLGVDPEALEKACSKPEIYKGLTRATFFDKETFGADKLVVGRAQGREGVARLISSQAPLSEAARAAILKIETGKDRSPARPFQRRQARPAFAPLLRRLSHDHSESRQGRAALLSAPHRRSVGLRHRRDLGAGLLGRRACRALPG